MVIFMLYVFYHDLKKINNYFFKTSNSKSIWAGEQLWVGRWVEKPPWGHCRHPEGLLEHPGVDGGGWGPWGVEKGEWLEQG